MSRLSHFTADHPDAPAAAGFAKIQQSIGRVPNTYLVIGSHNPGALKALLQADAAITNLNKTDAEVVRLYISEVTGCAYCVAAHSAIAKAVGMPDELISAARSGKATGQPKLDALLTFTRAVYGTKGIVPQAALQALRDAGYSEAQVIDVLLVMTLITFTNLVNRVNDTPLDFPPAPPLSS